MSFNQVIKGTILPNIALKELFEEDTSKDSATNGIYAASSELPDSSQKTGAREPFVKIGGQIVKGIELMTIDETGFIPTVSLTFTDDFGEFSGDYFPKTDLIMSLYLKSGSEKFKPVRCDFLITQVKSTPPRYTGSKQAISSGITYIVKGELYIPRIYEDVSRSYSNVTSKEALKRICSELGLGFAENDCSPNDKMTWINPSQNTISFLKSIISHAYQNDDSFFMGFIDKYYYLNFIEVNQQLKVEEAGETFATDSNALVSGITQNVKDSATRKQLEEETIVNYLTTELEYKGASNYITSLNLVSDQGSIIKRQGYRKKIYYYDHLKATQKPAEKFKDFFMQPLRSADRAQEQYLIPTEDALAQNQTKKWINIDYGNAHVEWNASKLLNSHNLKEIEKIKLKVSLNNINFQAIRGFTLPVFVTIQEAERLFKSTKKIDDQQINENNEVKLAEQTIDNQLSGYYYVAGAKYHYDITHPTGLYTELFLARREWAPSKKTE